MRLRFFHRRESHGKGPVSLVEGLPAGLPVSGRLGGPGSLPAHAGVRPGRPHEDRAGPHRVAGRHTRGGDDRVAGRNADSQPRLGQLGGRHGARGGSAGRDPSPAGITPRAQGTPTSPGGCSSTTGSTRATSSSAPVPGRPPPGWPRARWPAASSRSSAWRSAATWSRRRGARPADLPRSAQRGRRPLGGKGARRPRRRRSSGGSTPPSRPATPLGGEIEVVARGVVVGLGSHVSWDRKLDGRLAGMLMSIPAVEGGRDRGWVSRRRPAGPVHDPIEPAHPGRGRRTRLMAVTPAAGSGAGPTTPAGWRAESRPGNLWLLEWR